MTNIDKPCIRRCCLNEEEICLGCFRSFDDMCKWNKASREEKQQMLTVAEQRKRDYKQKDTPFKR